VELIDWDTVLNTLFNSDVEPFGIKRCMSLGNYSIVKRIETNCIVSEALVVKISYREVRCRPFVMMPLLVQAMPVEPVQLPRRKIQTK